MRNTWDFKAASECYIRCWRPKKGIWNTIWKDGRIERSICCKNKEQYINGPAFLNLDEWYIITRAARRKGNIWEYILRTPAGGWIYVINNILFNRADIAPQKGEKK